MKFDCPTCQQVRHVNEPGGDPRLDHCWTCGTPVPWLASDLARMREDGLSFLPDSEVAQRQAEIAATLSYRSCAHGLRQDSQHEPDQQGRQMTKPPEMPVSFRTILVQLELISHGSVQAWNKSAQPADKDWQPHGETFPPHERFAIDWYCAHNDTDRRRVETEAAEALEQARKRTIPKPVKPQPIHLRNEEIIKRGEGWEPRDVVNAFREITIRDVLAIREAAGRDPSTGKPLPEDEEPAAQAQRMVDQGMTVRQIAAYQGVQPSTVSRRLNRAA